MTDINPELRERLKEPVKEFIDYLEEREKDNVPTTSIYKYTNGNPTSKEVKKFGNICNGYTNDNEGFFEEVANWLAFSEHRYEPTRISTEDGDINYNELIEEYVEDFVYFTSHVLEHTGDFEFNEEAYNVAFDKKFKQEYGYPTYYKK